MKAYPQTDLVNNKQFNKCMLKSEMWNHVGKHDNVAYYTYK